MTDRPFRRLSPLTPLVRGFIVVVAAGTTVLRDVTRGDLGPAAVLLGMLLVGGGLFGIASWYRTKFWIEADELRVDTGVISRQSRRIRIDRLQGIDIVQPFVARLFGLAELRMDVAGGHAREGSLAFLPLGEARDLKDLLLAHRDEVRARTAPPEARLAAEGQAPTAEGATPTPQSAPVAAVPAPPVPERVLARVDLGTLMLSTLLSVETIVLVVLGTGLLAVFVASGEWLGASAVAPLLAGLGVVLFKRVSGNYGFTVSETPAGLQVRRGLFDLTAQTITVARIQGLVVTEPLLWRWLGWSRLDVSIAGYGDSSEDEGPAPSTVLPVGQRAAVAFLARHVLAGDEVAQATLHPAPREARWAAPVGWRYMAAGATDRLVVSREGWLTRRTHAAPHARVQSVRVTQGPWQRRLGLADLHLDSPPGPTRVRARNRVAAETREWFEVEVRVSREARRRLGRPASPSAPPSP